MSLFAAPQKNEKHAACTPSPKAPERSSDERMQQGL